MTQIKKNFFFIFLMACLYGCGQKKNMVHQRISLDTKMLDSIRLHSDTTYEKKYPRTDLVSAVYYKTKKDSTITQVMKDSTGTTRQVIISRNKIRIYFAAFYPNGQLTAKCTLDSYGQYDGLSEEYHENSSLKRKGFYRHGFHSGKWINFDENGAYVSTDEYNQDGQQVKSYVEQIE